jgi:hypothetical protein
LAAAALFCGCATAPPPLPLGTPIEVVLAAHGVAERATSAPRPASNPTSRPESSADSRPDSRSTRVVVVVMDRHFAGGGLTYVDDDLRALQREHRRLVADLLDRGFALFGAEWRRGPLPKDDDPAAAAHRDRARRALEEGDDLDRLSIYQPIRFEVEFDGRLSVVGVEDPKLYDADVAALERLQDLATLKRRHDTADGPDDDAILEEWARLRVAMRARIAPRGRAAARALIEEMDARGAERAILVLGAAHVPAAAEELATLGVDAFVFTAPSFARRDARPSRRPRRAARATLSRFGKTGRPRRASARRGKSGLRRAGWRLTTAGRKVRDSAAENRPPMAAARRIRQG